MIGRNIEDILNKTMQQSIKGGVDLNESMKANSSKNNSRVAAPNQTFI